MNIISPLIQSKFVKIDFPNNNLKNKKKLNEIK